MYVISNACVYIYIYIYMYMFMSMYIYIYGMSFLQSPILITSCYQGPYIWSYMFQGLGLSGLEGFWLRVLGAGRLGVHWVLAK